MDTQHKKIVFILKGYPRLSETFILQEIHALEQLGFDIHIMSMLKPGDTKTHDLVKHIRAPVTYMPPYVTLKMGHVFRAWRQVRCHAELVSASQKGIPKQVRDDVKPRIPLIPKQILSDIWATKSLNPLKRFFQALMLVADLPKSTSLLHAHFIHVPATLAYYAHLITGLPYTISAHAKDIWTSTPKSLSQKMASAQWVTCCTAEGQYHLQSLTSTPVHLIYHGIDLGRFPLRIPSFREANGRYGDKRVHLCLVGRLVPKKGIDILLEALALLPATLHWDLLIAGQGQMETKLKQQTRRLKLYDRIKFLGAVNSSEVKDLLQKSDLFVLPCKVEADGDRDGIPNVVMEAISQGLVVLSTHVGGITEILDAESAVLVPPNDIYRLTEALSTLILKPELRYTLAVKAQEKLQQQFLLEQGIAQLAPKFTETLSLCASNSRS